MVLKVARHLRWSPALGKASHAEALERAVLMAQGGEFAFVLYGAAVAVGLLSPEENAVLVAIIIVSMALTPLMVILHDRLAPRAAPSADGRRRRRTACTATR